MKEGADMTGAELIKWIQDNHAENMPIHVKTGNTTDDGLYYLYGEVDQNEIWINGSIVYLDAKY